MKKWFDLTWPKLFIFSILIGVYAAIIALIPGTKDTSFSNLNVTFEVWILFGILIIMNSKSALDSALKCFIFFLISQPLIYLIQDFINGSNLFKMYYRYWFMWTIACIPMGYIGYYMKKDKWWGLLILTPILVLLSKEYGTYLSKTMFSFPRHILTTIFCFTTLIIYPIAIFKNKKIKLTGLLISTILIIVISTICVLNPPIYETDILANSKKFPFDDKYKVYLVDKKYGDLSFKYELDAWMVHAKFKKEGKTKFVIESPKGEKTTFNLIIRRDTYKVTKKK